MKFSGKKRTTAWYSAAILFSVAFTALILFSFYDLDKSYRSVSDTFQKIVVINNIDSELAAAEIHLYKNRDIASFQICDSVYKKLTIEMDMLKIQTEGDTLQKEKFSAIMNILNERGKNPEEINATQDEKLRGKEIREFMEKDRFSRLNKPVTDLKLMLDKKLDDVNKKHELRKSIFLGAIPVSGFLLLVLVVTAFINGGKREKLLLRKRADLIDLADVSTAANEREEFFRGIHEIIKKNLSAKNFYAAIINNEDRALEFPYFINEFDSKPENRINRKGLAEYVIKINKPFLAGYDDLTLLMEQGEIESEGTPAYSWLGAPLRRDGEAVGVIALQSYEPKTIFNQDDLELINFAAGLASLAISGKYSLPGKFEITPGVEDIADEVESKNKELAEAHEKITDAEKLIKSLKASKEKYFSILSHDLKTPFNSIIGFTDILMEDIDDLEPDEIKKYVGIISGSAHNLLNLIENLVQWSKLQRNKLDFQPEEAKLKGEVNYIFDLLKEQAEKKSIVFFNKVNEDVTVFADKNMFHLIMQNLVGNAIKFTSKGGRVVIEASIKPGATEIIVADTGIGIKKENVEKLFRFEKSFSTKGTDNEPGTGLGLVLVKEFVEKHKGNIKVSSVEGKGTAVFVELPLNYN